MMLNIISSDIILFVLLVKIRNWFSFCFLEQWSGVGICEESITSKEKMLRQRRSLEAVSECDELRHGAHLLRFDIGGPCSWGGGTVVQRDSGVPVRVGQSTGGDNALPHAEQGRSYLAQTMECHAGVQCRKGVLHVPPWTATCGGDGSSSICARGAVWRQVCVSGLYLISGEDFISTSILSLSKKKRPNHLQVRLELPAPCLTSCGLAVSGPRLCRERHHVCNQFPDVNVTSNWTHLHIEIMYFSIMQHTRNTCHSNLAWDRRRCLNLLDVPQAELGHGYFERFSRHLFFFLFSCLSYLLSLLDDAFL